MGTYQIWVLFLKKIRIKIFDKGIEIFNISIDTSVGYSDRKRFPSNTYQIWVLSKICF